MTFEEIKREVDKLPAAERRKLGAYLVTRIGTEDDRIAARAAKLDDPVPNRWIDLDQVSLKSRCG